MACRRARPHIAAAAYPEWESGCTGGQAHHDYHRRAGVLPCKECTAAPKPRQWKTNPDPSVVESARKQGQTTLP